MNQRTASWSLTMQTRPCQAAVSAVSAVTEQHVTQTQTALGGKCSVLVQDIPEAEATVLHAEPAGHDI